MSRKIKRRDRDLEWFSAYRDLENPGRIKAQQSSNMVFIGAVSVIGIAAIFYVQLMNENMGLERQIKVHQDYVNNEHNKDIYEWHTLLQERSRSLINYRDGAEKYLEQLKMANRISEEQYRFFEEALKSSTSQTAYITGFVSEFNSIQIKGIVPEENMPRIYAEYLTTQTDDEGNPQFTSVEYNGFSRNNQSGYEFTVTVVLWQQPK